MNPFLDFLKLQARRGGVTPEQESQEEAQRKARNEMIKQIIIRMLMGG